MKSKNSEKTYDVKVTTYEMTYGPKVTKYSNVSKERAEEIKVSMSLPHDHEYKPAEVEITESGKS